MVQERMPEQIGLESPQRLLEMADRANADAAEFFATLKTDNRWNEDAETYIHWKLNEYARAFKDLELADVFAYKAILKSAIQYVGDQDSFKKKEIAIRLRTSVLSHRPSVEATIFEALSRKNLARPARARIVEFRKILNDTLAMIAALEDFTIEKEPGTFARFKKPKDSQES